MRVNPLTYFQEHPVNEGLVLQLAAKLPGSLIIVVDSPILLYTREREHPERRIREFLRLQFGEIKHYSRTQASQRLEKHQDYNARRDAGGVVIYGVKVTATEQNYFFEATFSNFGRASFQFSSLTVDRRITEALRESVADDWKYVDRASGKVVDFYDPFSELGS